MILGGFLIICALCFLAIAPALRPVMIPLALFCGVAAVACFSTGSHPVTIRLIGATSFIVCLLDLGSTARTPMEKTQCTPRRGVPSIVYGLYCFVVIGLPVGCAAAPGRYPGWGQGAEAFHGKKRRKGSVAGRHSVSLGQYHLR